MRSPAFAGAVLCGALVLPLRAQGQDTRPAPLPLIGALRDAGGNPVVCARVQQWSPFDDSVTRVTQSDGSGLFALPGSARGQRTWIVVSAPGFCDLTRELRPPLEATDLTVSLLEGLEVTGTVCDARGEPIAGAWVAAFSSAGGGRSETRTDAKGRYALRARGAASISAWAPGTWVESSESGVRDFFLGPDDGKVTTVRLAPRLVERLRGKCVARLGLIGQHGPLPSPVEWQRFDASWSFQVRGLRQGRLVVSLVAEDPLLVVEPKILVLPRDAGTIATIDGPAEPSQAFVGRLLNEAREPLGGVHLALSVGGGIAELVTTGDDGTYRCTVHAQVPRPFVRSNDPRWFVAASLAPELVAIKAGRIRGRVVDGAGETVPNALVRIAPGAQLEALGPATLGTRTDARGGFELGGLKPTDVRFTLLAETDHHVGRLEGVAVRDPESDGRETLRVHASAEVLGRILLADGTPLGNFPVELQRLAADGEKGGDRVVRVESDSHGEFRFRGLLPGSYRLRQPATLDSKEHESFDLAAGQKRRLDDLRLPPLPGTRAR